MTSSWTPQPTEDGSFTFFSEEFGETFHSHHGAKTEAFQKFADATNLSAQATQPSVRLLDVCYGLGYNTAAALETIWAMNPVCEVEWVGLELDATVPQAAIAPAFLRLWSAPVQTALQAIANNYQHHSSTLNARLLLGDARHTIQPLAESGFQADAIFFDPFSPRRCPQLWTVDFFTWVARCLAPTGTLATYSRSASVRSALLEAGFCIGTIPLGDRHLPHEWAQGTVAGFDPRSLHPLSPMEQEHLQTRAAIPYRDPTLSDSAPEIHARHQQEQHSSHRESTSNWRRRWGIE
ncbi:MAG: MnmC family methyltransferase [Leptolyngbyaceae cyanobacterium bins.302]|nr:MnmC family methyltransferase [Leptolyngbyaceae cyanobacterium bins.302]